MKTRYPARTALVTALALTFGASVFAADQVAQSQVAQPSAASSATERSATSAQGTSAQDGTRSADPQLNPGQSGFNDWTQRNNTTAPGTSNAQDATTRGASTAGSDTGTSRNDLGTAGAVGGSSYGSGATRSNAQDTTTRGSNMQDRTTGAGAAGTMRDGTSRDATRHQRGMMTDGNSMSDAMRRQHDGMMRGDAAAQQDMLNHVEPGASETRVHLYPDSGNAQAD